MKKAISILLLSIHLFSIGGYKLFFSLAEKEANQQMIASLDNNNYGENELIQIKVALNMPYLISNKNYERCNGQVELHGIQYNYVKRMVNNDTMYLYCIPNQQKTKISDTKNLYAKQNADNSSGKSEQPAIKKISFFSDYNIGALNFCFNSYHSSSPHPISINYLPILKGFTTKHLQPPDLFI